VAYFKALFNIRLYVAKHAKL